MTIEEIAVEAAANRLADFHVVDVREEAEYDGPLGHIEGAVLIPLGQLEERTDELAADRDVLFVCRSGNRSGIACQQLAGRAGGRLINLVGGMIAWNEAGLAVVKRSPDGAEGA